MMDEPHWLTGRSYLDENRSIHPIEEEVREAKIEIACRKRGTEKCWRTVEEAVIARHRKEYREFRRV
jgi:hypothetical protein